MQTRPLLFYFFLAATFLLIYGCANPVSPEGGKKDTDPPRVLRCDPPNFSIHFKEDKFSIDFDEYVQLKNPISEIFFSPPLKNPPDPRLRGKSLIINLDDTLSENTTYSVSFGNAIADLTESNVLKGFSYVFSTGDYIDSLSLKGSVVSAFDLKPQKDIIVALYINNNDTLPLDSLPLKVIPYYISKTGETGEFVFHNLQNRKFKLFALSDQNGDLIFNQPSEKIAFADSLVEAYFIKPPAPDTTGMDTLANAIDSLQKAAKLTPAELARTDSVRKADSVNAIMKLYPSYSLYLYEETDSVQRLLKNSYASPGVVTLAFRYPVKEVMVKPLYTDTLGLWYLEEYSARRDSLMMWITRSDMDSLTVSIDAGQTEPDTVNLDLKERLGARKPQGGKETTNALKLSLNVKGSKFNQYKNRLELVTSTPLTRWDFSGMFMVSDKDTVRPRFRFADSLHRRIIVDHNWAEDKRYKLTVPDSAFTGLNSLSHDTVRLDISTSAERDFGNFNLTVKTDSRPGRYIIQLINETETAVYEERILMQTGRLSFQFLQPGKYKVKSILDRNNNGRWDTGNYRKKIQPEEVRYFPKTIEVRANWDVDESWDQAITH